MQTLRIKKENLQRGLAVVSKAVAQKGVIPILSNVKLKSDGEYLQLGATDLEIAMTCLVETEEAEEFSTTIPAKIFSELISAIQEDDLRLEYNPEKLVMKIQTEKSNNNVRCLNPEDFPDMPVFPENFTFELPPENFREMVQRSIFSTATADAAQPLYKGVLFECIDEELALVSTDGIRFSMETTHVKSGDFNVVIPASHLNEFSKVATDNVKVAVLEKSVVLESGDVTCGILSLFGKFPNIREQIDNFLPKEEGFEASGDTADLYRAVKHASIFCPEEKRTLTLNFKLVTEIFAQADQIGDSLVSVMLDCNGEITTHLNADYLMGVLGVAPEKVKFYTGGESEPFLVKFNGLENYLHVMMPIRA